MNSQKLLDIIEKRRSIRKFKQTAISFIDVRDLIIAGIHAPSGSNSQCYRFVIITNKDDRNFLGQAKIPIVANAPLIILAVADLRECKYLNTARVKIFNKLPYQDVAIAMQNMCLMATTKGIGSCIIHLSEEWKTAKQIKERFHLKDYHELMGLILFGYSDEKINYDKAVHAGKPIKRKTIHDYILAWRE